ncbi:MAG: hypothetical protein A4E55_02058 [Pelotomaculum sp. PtaU1.Bin035]|nr:MAG: hypothetical protein A4E55_02058 [Pelotomaculum sp. PtaU1.Bin035]
MSDKDKIFPEPKVSFFKTGTEALCPNTPVTPTPITRGAIAKIPVVLAELTVQINVDSTITLPEPAFEIKQIKKRLKLTQCLLAQPTNKLFLKGFIRKNIDYSTRSCSNNQGFCGDIRHCTVDIPFTCVTPVDFNVTEPAPVTFNTAEEFEFFRAGKLGPEFPEKDTLESGDFTEFNQVSTEFFNELPFCEIINARITEYDEFVDRKHPFDDEIPFEEIKFKAIEEKMVIDLTLKVLQKRQVTIPAVALIDC